jgi:hypothetical protein
VNRAELKQLAEDRVLDAQALLAAGRWSGAYYLAGYAVECGLKACVLAHVERTGIIFVDKKYAEKCWTHDLKELVKLAELEVTRAQDCGANPALEANWRKAFAWSEMARYEQKTEAEARDLFGAVTENVNGVLPWIRVRW